MILQALYQLAEREGLMTDPDFEPKRVAWLVRVDKGGKLLGIEGTHDVQPAEGKKSPKPIAKKFSVPREKARTSGDHAFFFYDKAEYIFGLDPAGKRTQDQLAARLALFRQRVRECAAASSDEGARAVSQFLDSLAAGAQQAPLPDDCQPNDLFAFVYAPDVDRLVTERDGVRAYWRHLRTLEQEDHNRQCLVSGNVFAQNVGNFPPLKNVPGGTTSGVGLVSFNKSAFESYGWKGNQNAPISRQAAEACSTALNRLLDPAIPAGPGRTLQPGGTTKQKGVRGDLSCPRPTAARDPQEGNGGHRIASAAAQRDIEP